MPVFPRLRAVLAVTGAAVLLAACDGEDDDLFPDDVGRGGQPADEATPADGDGTAVAQGRELAQLITRGFASTVRVTYERRTPQGDTQTMVLASDGQRTAWRLPTARMITRADGTRIVCRQDDQPPRCFRAGGRAPSAPAASIAPFLGVATALEQELEGLPGYAAADQREIAGRTARCATFNPAGLLAGPSTGEATLCVDADTGVLLSYGATAPEAGTATFEAVELGDPREEDFAVPAEPVPMEQMGS